MKTRLSRKFMAMFFTLCMVLSFVPIPAFAAELDFLPQGVTYSKDNKHTYHTQINVTANVSVKDSTGTVVETTQVSKSTEDFLEGDVVTLQGKLANLQTEIETPYKANGTVTRENLNDQVILDHFETATFYKFIPTSGDTIDFLTDLEQAKQYFDEHQDATGTFTETYDSHQYQKCNYTYDLNVQKNSQSTSTITEANIENAKFDYQPGDTPQATARVAAADQNKYEIAYECWQQFENNNPVAAWYSDNSSHALPTITEFESGKRYVYSVMLKPKDGYSFSSETVITVNGQKVSAPFVGGSMYIPSIKTININTVTTIDIVEINDVTVSFKDGDKPVFTGKVPDGADYAYRCEWWELDSKTGAMSTDFGNFYENKFTNFEAGKTYHYGVYVTTIYGDRYVFGPDTKLKINGEFVNYKRYEGDTSDGSDGTMWVITDLTMTPQASGTVSDYKIIEGANSSWVQNADKTLTFRINGDFSKFVGIKVDDEWVDKENYTTASGSTIVTLKNEYLKTLSDGEHKITFVYTDGEVSTNFEVKETGKIYGNSDNPKTGDNSNILIWTSLFAANALAMLGIIVYNKKKKSII